MRRVGWHSRILSFLFITMFTSMMLSMARAEDLFAGMYHGLVTQGVRRYNAPSGTNMNAFGVQARQIEGLVFAPDGTAYLADGHLNQILHYNPANGQLLRIFATGAPSGPDLDSPRGMAFGADGLLYVASFWNSRILRYDPVTGQMLGIFFQGGVFEKPMGLIFHNGILYAANYHGGVLRFNAATGARLTDVATEAFSADTVLFDGSGRMFVSDNFFDRILRYATPTSAGTVWIPASTDLDGPRGLALDADGSLYVASFWKSKILRYQVSTGTLLGTFATGDAFFKPTALVLRAPALMTGNLTLQAIAPNAAPHLFTFTFRPVNGTAFDRTAMIGPNGAFYFYDIPSGEYQVHIKGTRYLAANVPVSSVNNSAFGITATLFPGDADDDNSVNVLDLDLLIQAFDTTPASSQWNPNVDFNGDDSVDVLDLDLLIQFFDREGDA